MRTYKSRSWTIGYEIPIAIHCITACNYATCSAVCQSFGMLVCAAAFIFAFLSCMRVNPW